MVYVPQNDLVMFTDDQLLKHLNGQHDQSTHSHRGTAGAASAKTPKKEAMKVPDKVSKDNLVSATFPYVGLSEKAQGIAANISDVKTTHNNPPSTFASIVGGPETISTATYTDRDGVEHYMKIYEAPSADGTGVHGMVMTFSSKESLEAHSATNDKSGTSWADGYEGALEYGADFRNPIITEAGLNASKIYQARSSGKGVGTAMLEFARSTSPFPIFHSTLLTEEGAEFAATTKSVEKHLQGKHDQSSHSGGKGATGGTSVSGKVTRSVLDKVKENGGLSVRLTNGTEPTTGFMVARKGMGAIVEAKDFFDPSKGKQILSDYMKKHKSELATGKDYLGIWHNKDDGKVYFDVSANISDRQTAIEMGQTNDQISIWDVVNFEEIATGGTGNV